MILTEQHRSNRSWCVARGRGGAVVGPPLAADLVDGKMNSLNEKRNKKMSA